MNKGHFTLRRNTSLESEFSSLVFFFLHFHGARFQRGYGLGSIFKGLFCWAMPHLQHGAKVLGKKALQTGVQVAQDVLAGENVKTATKKCAKQALGLPSQNSSHSGGGRKATKRKAESRKKQFASRQESESISAAKEETRREDVSSQPVTRNPTMKEHLKEFVTPLKKTPSDTKIQ